MTFYLILNVFLLLCSLFFNNEQLLMNGYIILSIQFIIGFFLIFKDQKIINLYLFFSPSFLSFLYLGINLSLGAYFIPRDYGSNPFYFTRVSVIANWNYIMIILLISNFIVYNQFLKTLVSIDDFIKDKQIQEIKISFSLFLLSSVLLFIFAFAGINLSFLGASDCDFSYPFKIILVIIIILFFIEKRAIIRLIIYVILLSYFVSTNFTSKRQIFYFIILVIFIESFYKKIKFKISFSVFLSVIIAVFSFLYIIILSSIMRGYGSFGVESPLEAMAVVGDYIQADYFNNTIIDNLELSCVYGNSVLCLEYILDGSIQLQFGKTFMKIFIIFLPKEVFPRPDNMIRVYTDFVTPGYITYKGSSLPVIIFCELFANFYLLFAPALYFLYRGFDYIFVFAIKELFNGNLTFGLISSLYLIGTSIQFIRGSGLELYLIYYFVTIPLIFLLISVFLSSNKSVNKNVNN